MKNDPLNSTDSPWSYEDLLRCDPNAGSDSEAASNAVSNTASWQVTPHKKRGLIAGACAAVLAVVVAGAMLVGVGGGFGFPPFGLPPTGDSSSQEAVMADQLKDSNAADDVQADASATQTEPDINDIFAPRPVVHEESGVEYRSNQLLVGVDPDTTAQSINESLAAYGFVVTKDVSNQDLSQGYVKVNLTDDIHVYDATELLEADGLSASPNYVLHIMDGETDGETETADETDGAQVSVPASVSDSTSVAASASGADSSSASASATNPDLLSLMGPFAQRALSLLNLSSQAVTQTTSSIAPQATYDIKEWMLDSMDVRNAWNIQTSSHAVSVAVLDTGCLTNHADLRNNWVAGYNAVTKTEQSSADDTSVVQDNNGHGTHVAGIVAADTTNSVGAKGTSGDAGLVIIKVADADGKIDTSSVLNAYNWLLDNSGHGSQTRAQYYNVRVVNMSLGGKIDSDVPGTFQNMLYKRIDDASAAGILSVAAAGNASTTAKPPYYIYPGDYPACFEVINLAAVGTSGSTYDSTTQVANDSGNVYKVKKDSSSNYNTNAETVASTYTKDISAPGSNIYSTYNNSNYAHLTGTSMAAPAVSGVAALIFANEPTLTARQVQTLMEATATDLSGQGVWCQEYGYGEVDAYRALQVTSAEVALSDTLEFSTITSLTLKFGSTTAGSTTAGSTTAGSTTAGSTTAGDTTADGTTADSTTTGDTTANNSQGSMLSMEEWKQTATSSRDKWTWTSSDPSVAAIVVDDAGTSDISDDYDVKVQALKEGTVTLTATYNGLVTASKTITVTPFDLNNADVSFVDADDPNALIAPEDASWVYTGAEVSPMVRVISNDTTFAEGTDYMVSYSHNTNAGTATVVVSAKEGGSCKTGTSKTVEFAIAQQDMSEVSIAEIPAQRFTSAQVTCSPVISYRGAPLVENSDYTLSYGENTQIGSQAGSVTVAAKKDADGAYVGNFKGDVTVYFDITASILDAVVVFDDALNAMDGAPAETPRYHYKANKAVEPKPTVTIGGHTLQEGTDYLLEYDNNASVGTATVKIRGNGSYTDSLTATVEIVARPLSSAGVAVGPAKVLNSNGELVQPDTAQVVYGDNPSAPKYTVVCDGVELTEGTHYRVECPTGSQSVGNNYTATIQAIEGSNFAGSITMPFKVMPRSIEGATVVFDHSAYVYTGSAITPVPAVTIQVDQDTILTLTSVGANPDFTIDYTNNVEKGTAIATLKGTGNYTGTVLAEFSIVSQLAVSSIPDQTYTGKPIEPDVTVMAGDMVLTRGVDYIVEYKNNTAIHSATGNEAPQVIVKGLGPYSGTVVAKFAIIKPNLSAAKISVDPATYTGQALTPSVKVEYGETVLTEGTDYALFFANNINACAASASNAPVVTIVGKGNYAGTATAKFTINKANIGSAQAYATAQTYSGDALCPDPTVIMDGHTLVKIMDYTVSYSNNINAGNGLMTVIGKGNYEGTLNAGFTINKASISNATITIAAQTYTGSELTPNPVVKYGSRTLIKEWNYTVSYSNNVNVGSGMISVTGIGNFTGTLRKTFPITAASGTNPGDSGGTSNPGDSSSSGSGTAGSSGSSSSNTNNAINSSATSNPNVEKVQEVGSVPLPAEALSAGSSGGITPGDITIDMDISAALAASSNVNANNFYIDGKQGSVQVNNGRASVTVDRSETHIVTAYEYNSASSDTHTVYPTRMYGWILEPNIQEGTYTAKRCYALDDLLIYAGCSIRVTGNKGIRMITSVFDNTKSYLSGTGVEGWKMVETGTVIAWADNAPNGQLTVDSPGVVRGIAYKAGVKDPIFGQGNGRSSYTNVMILPDSVGANEMKRDIAMRPYVLLQDEEGNQAMVYGGTIYRSVQYIAQQNANSFNAGTNAHTYIHGILSACS